MGRSSEEYFKIREAQDRAERDMEARQPQPVTEHWAASSMKLLAVETPQEAVQMYKEMVAKADWSEQHIEGLKEILQTLLDVAVEIQDWGYTTDADLSSLDQPILNAQHTLHPKETDSGKQ